MYPADGTACGHFRLIWTAEALQRQGYDVTVVPQEQRQLLVSMAGDDVLQVGYPADMDVAVFQRITHKHLIGVIRYLRSKGIAVIVDADDDLNSVDPRNPAWAALHPKGTSNLHSWHYLSQACREATFVSVSTPGLTSVYGQHGRVRVIQNFLPSHYFGLERTDNPTVGWAASLHSHPDDPQVTRGAVGRLVREGATFRIVGNPEGTGRAFGLETDPEGTGPIDLLDWPRAVSTLGVGIAPLNDTKFARSKSHLKPLEMAACGVPFVASPRREYAAFHREGAGLLAGDKGKDWYRALRQLTGSASMRQELSEAGRAVAERFRLEREAWRWAELFEDALALQRGQRVPA